MVTVRDGDGRVIAVAPPAPPAAVAPPTTQHGATMKAVARHFGVWESALVGAGRTRRVVQARHLLMYLLHEQGLSTTQIGRIVRRDHTTVVYGIRRATCRLAQDEGLRAGIEAIRGSVTA